MPASCMNCMNKSWGKQDMNSGQTCLMKTPRDAPWLSPGWVCCAKEPWGLPRPSPWPANCTTNSW
eukprot:9402030-Alexandrium_andersonii.AAC.1